MNKEENYQLYGPYKIVRPIAKGGMGEVFLAYDNICKRYVALKRIRSDLENKENIQKRFIREARIASSLAHPNIIPIYNIQDQDNAYYTMPYVEGKTLKQILKEAYYIEKKEGKISQEGSIPSLMRVFLTICEAISYAHARGILHRDIKPENILIGKYGEVFIFDWGVAEKTKIAYLEDEEDCYLSSINDKEDEYEKLTRPGKIVGTLPFMAPQRIFGRPATPLADIYALGVMLYFILTLRLPFKRKSLKEARQTVHLEQWPEPTKVAPYRDIPQMLIHIVKKCLYPDPQKRYQTVKDLIKDLKQFIEGGSEWFQIAELNIHKKEDWQFQENVLLTKQLAIAPDDKTVEWVSLMISKASFEGTTQLKANVKITEGKGIGFLLCVPESQERNSPYDGYSLWLGDTHIKLFRGQVEVLHLTEMFLENNKWFQVRIEKIDNNFYLYLSEELIFSYISHLPLIGTHIGVLYRDADFEVSELIIAVASPSITISCLAVPDSLLAYKAYDKALIEYRRIGYSFPGRHEGREAFFRAGVTLLEQAKNFKAKKNAKKIFSLALDEFEKLRHTPGAPLEYLGKALVYEALNENAEELKCLELGIRRYRQHPLLSLVYAQIIYRMHQSSSHDRRATYRFALLATRHIPKKFIDTNSIALIKNSKLHGDDLFFLEPSDSTASEIQEDMDLSIYLSISLAKPYIILEIINEILHSKTPSPTLLRNALMGLYFLGVHELNNTIKEKLTTYIQQLPKDNRNDLALIEALIPLINKTHLSQAITLFFKHVNTQLTSSQESILFFLLEEALRFKQEKLIEPVYLKLEDKKINYKQTFRMACYRLWGFLLLQENENCESIFNDFSLDDPDVESSIFFFLYGCYLQAVKGKKEALKHFLNVLEVPFPKSYSLGCYYISKKLNSLNSFKEKAFSLETKEFYKQLYLFYTCQGDSKLSQTYYNLWLKEFPSVKQSADPDASWVKKKK